MDESQIFDGVLLKTHLTFEIRLPFHFINHRLECMATFKVNWNSSVRAQVRG